MAIDRLSTLSADLLSSHILSKLSLRDAMKCSLLSRRWRCLWTLLPHLEFIEEETETIDNILFFHSAELESLEISHCHGTDYKMLWKWVRCASLKRVKQIILDNTLDPTVKVPTSLFSCDCLTVLKLMFSEFPQLPPHFCGFNYLVTCSLSLVTIGDDMLEELVEKCPLLEDLEVRYCVRLSKLKISAGNLKHLNFTGNCNARSVTGNCPQLVDIRVDNCRSLRMKFNSCRALHLYTCNLWALENLSTTNSFTKITLDGCTWLDSLTVLSRFNDLEELRIESDEIKVIGSFTFPVLEKLKKAHLKVSRFNCKEIVTLKWLLRSSHFLQTMTLSLPICPRSIHDKAFLKQLLSLKRSSRDATIRVTEYHVEYCKGCLPSSDDDEDAPSSDDE